MENDLYNRLETLRNNFYRELKDFESFDAETLLTFEDEIALGSIESLNHPLKSYLASELILKNFSSEFKPLTIQIKLECLNYLKIYINENLIIKELKLIKKNLKNKLFRFDLETDKFLNFLNIIKRGAKLSEIFEIIFDSDFFQELSHLLGNMSSIKRELIIFNSSEDRNIKIVINKAYDKSFDLKMSYAKRLNKTIADLINNSSLNSQEKSNLIFLNNQRYEQRIKLSKVESICETLDKKIIKLIKNLDNFESLPLNFSNTFINLGTNEINQILENSKIDFLDNEKSFLNVNINSSESNYVEFEKIFLYTLNSMFISLSRCLNELFTFLEFRIKGLNLLKAFRFLRGLPSNISQTICEIMLGASDPCYQSSYYKFFLRDMYKNLKFEKIKVEVCNKFISLALKSPIREILERFNKTEFSLEQILWKVTPNIYFMSFPDKITGITLKTRQITLKLFESGNFKDDHKLGGNFVLYLHELANYLQRTCFDCVEQTNRRIISDLDKSEPNEGGISFETLVFGEQLIHIYYTQAIFLLRGVYPYDIKEFRNEYFTVKQNDNEPLLPLSRSQDIIFFGNCGSLYGLISPRWLPCQLKY